MRCLFPSQAVSAAAMLVTCMVVTTMPALGQDDCDRSDWPASYRVGTASQGGTYFIYGSGWANMTAEALDLNAGVEATGGPVQNLALVQTGELDFAMTTMGPASLAINGQSPLVPGLVHDRVRAIFPMYETPFVIIALTSSGIERIADIPSGAVVAVGPAGGTADTYFPAILEMFGVDIEKRNGGISDLAGQLQDGLIDAFAIAGGVPIPAFAQLEAQVDVNIFGFTDEEVELVIEHFPVLPFTIPADVYHSSDGVIPTVSMWNFAIASADVPDCLVYHVVDTVMTNNDAMVLVHGAARATVPENFERNRIIPWHSGAVRWFEEHGYDIPDDLEG